MAEKKQNSSLTDLLDRVEKFHKAEVQLYTTGHLNHNNLFKPQGRLKQNYWGSARKPALLLRKAQLTAPRRTSRWTKHYLASDIGVPIHTHAQPASHLSQRPWASKAHSDALADVPASRAVLSRQRMETPEEEEEGEGLFQRELIKEELDVPKMKTLKCKPIKNSRLCVLKETKDEYQFIPSYLAGVTKSDQYYKFMQFQKDVIGKQDLLENDFVGSKSVEQHERKLAQALWNICDCNRPHYYRLQAIGDVFEDICNSSLIFGDILRDVKNEYELYMALLLDALPTMQYRTLQNEIKGIEKRPCMTHEIEEKGRDIQVLGQKFKSALARNEELRNMLEIELWVSQSVSKTSEQDKGDSEKSVSLLLSSAEQMISLRRQIIKKWKQIQAMEKEIKDTMTFAGIVNIREKTVKELEGEAAKLQGSNKFLRKQIKVVEQTIKETLKRQKLNTEAQRFFWSLVRDFLIPAGKNEPFELNSSYSSLSLLSF